VLAKGGGAHDKHGEGGDAISSEGWWGHRGGGMERYLITFYV